MREVIRTENAPVPAGAYSQAIVSDGLVFVAGQGPRDPKTGQNASGGVAAETRQVLNNIQAILAAAGCSMKDVVKVNVYLRDAADFAEMNAVYQTFWPENPPARTTVQAIPPADILVEIDCVARRPQ
jgi:2-iminobutanoate/2-iminopropanoate deaminase